LQLGLEAIKKTVCCYNDHVNVYKSKYGLTPGTSYKEIMAAARREYHIVQKRSPKRTPYVRSSYFGRDKVFLNTFWNHLKQKHPSEQAKRLRVLPCST
jgi:hypothetical protein